MIDTLHKYFTIDSMDTETKICSYYFFILSDTVFKLRVALDIIIYEAAG